jgi:hypothetical protein
MMSIRQQTEPNLIGKPNVPLFENNLFESVIWNKGYDILVEQAVACPCRGRSGSAKPTCLNCLGLGHMFINPIQTKAIISSINKDTKYKNWSMEMTGTIAVTVRGDDHFSFFDKITFRMRVSEMSEVKPVQIVQVSIGNLHGSVAHTVANSATTKQKEIVTLLGTSGEAKITGAGGLSKVVIFSSSLTLTATGFALANAAAYLAVGVTLTSSGGTLIFESTTVNVAIIPPVIANNTNSNRFVFLSYKVNKIKSVFIFNSDSTKLILLGATDYSVSANNLMILQLRDNLTLPSDFNGVVSVDYSHELSYNVVDLPHDFRSAFIPNEKGQQIETFLPIQAIARRSHIVLGEPTNYIGNNLLDNSFL